MSALIKKYMLLSITVIVSLVMLSGAGSALAQTNVTPEDKNTLPVMPGQDPTDPANLEAAQLALSDRVAAPDLSAISAFIEQQVQRHKIPGLAVAITQGDQVIFSQGYGFSREGEPVTPQTPFYIGSLSKSFTALAVMQLVEAGKVDLDAPVQLYLPWFSVADEDVAARITVRHLLNQTSGMSKQGFNGPRLPLTATMEENARELAAARLTAPVGSKFQYFNHNYVLLGLVVEAVSEQRFGEMLAAHIFEPLEMNTTFTDQTSAQAAGLAQGHNSFLGLPLARTEPFLAYDLPAGFIISCAEDMAHYLIAQNNDGRFGENSILSSDGIETLHRPVTEIGSPYAMGWFESEQDGIPLVFHGGDLETFSAMMRLLPEQGYGIVLLTNQNHMLQSAWSNNRIVDGITDLLLGHEPVQQAFAADTFYTGMILLLLLTYIWFGYRFVKLSGWDPAAHTRFIGKLPVRVLWQLFFPWTILIGIPALLISSQGVWAIKIFLWNFLPGVSLWLFSVAILNLLEGCVKTYKSLRTAKAVLDET
jgi:CubicO group peptidase (beta-lactamase class C family)